MDSVVKNFGDVMSNQDTQMAVAGFLCFIGGWIVLTRVIQFLFSVLWPFFVLIGSALIAIQFFPGWFTEVLPQYTRATNDFLRKFNEEYVTDNIRR